MEKFDSKPYDDFREFMQGVLFDIPKEIASLAMKEVDFEDPSNMGEKIEPEIFGA